jgi:cell division septation protein DedD
LTVKQLTLIFIASVGVCAVFFTLGFLVGANERNVNSDSATVERVSPPGDIPPPVNGPLNTASSSGGNPAGSIAGSSGQVQEENLPQTGSSGVKSAPASPPTTAPAVSTRTATNPPAPGKGAAATPAQPSNSGLIVQVAALHSEKDAMSMVATLRSQHYPAFLVTPGQAGTDDDIYRVQIGPYPTRPAAETIKDKLAKEGFNPFIK